MDQFLFHPKMVHLPIALAFLMPLVAGGVAFACRRSWLDRRAWAIVFVLQGILVGSGLTAMYTGEAEEERVGQIVAEHHIESHEEAAEIFLWTSAIVLALMAVPLVLGEGEPRDAAVAMACIGSLLALAFAQQVGEAGGRLVYEYGAANAYLTPAGTSPDSRIQAIDEYEDDADSDE